MTRQEFGSRYHNLVWSRSDAPPEVILRAALMSPRFHIILDACKAFGLEGVRAEWQALLQEANQQVRRVAPIVERILRNIEMGVRHAAH